LKIGQGGDARIANLLGVDPHTVAKGRRELLQRDIDASGVRKRGGGRPSAEKKPRKSSPA
jgi:transposase-like protein